MSSRRSFILSSAGGGLAVAATVLGCGGGGAEASEPPANSPTNTTGMRNLNSVQLSQLMGAGWNLGNSLEATGGETAWGNAATTPTLLNAVKAAGFKTMRIPVSWKQYADANDNISTTWMARVTQVVRDAQAAGFFVIINIHWDGGWMQPTYARQAEANARITTFWTQIANNFKSFDDTLLFAGTNEVMVDGDYGTPKAEYVAVQNSFNQNFVTTVRATGGNNAVRYLVVQGFNTNIEHTLAFAVLPTDPAAGRLMMEVHFYDPYHFTIDENSSIWQWGATATDPAATDTWGNEAHVDAQFQKMKTRYVDRGVAVILGEYGAMARNRFPGADTYRNLWNLYVTRAAWTRGLVPVYWDNGATGDHGMGLFNRGTGAQVFPTLISSIVNAAR